MSSRTTFLDDRLYDYFQSISLRESDLLQRLRAETAGLPDARMQVSPEQGQFMGLLVQLIGARRALEVGTFTGYSSLCVATHLPHDGELIACDVNKTWTRIAERYWIEAGVADKIKLHLAPAAETLEALVAAGQIGTFDFAFIDADKPQYDLYYEQSLNLLRSGGLLALDNCLWGGKVADPQNQEEETSALRQITKKVHEDTRVDASLIPIGDGLLLARKRSW